MTYVTNGNWKADGGTKIVSYGSNTVGRVYAEKKIIFSYIDARRSARFEAVAAPISTLIDVL